MRESRVLSGLASAHASKLICGNPKMKNIHSQYVLKCPPKSDSSWGFVPNVYENLWRPELSISSYLPNIFGPRIPSVFNWAQRRLHCASTKGLHLNNINIKSSAWCHPMWRWNFSTNSETYPKNTSKRHVKRSRCIKDNWPMEIETERSVSSLHVNSSSTVPGCVLGMIWHSKLLWFTCQKTSFTRPQHWCLFCDKAQVMTYDFRSWDIK